MKAIESVTRKRFKDEALEGKINAVLDDTLALVRLSGGRFGRNNLPLLTGDSMKSYFEPFLFEYQGLIDQVNVKLQSQLTCFEVTEQEKLADGKINNLERKLEDAEQEHASISGKVGRIQKPAGYNAIFRARLCMLIVAGFDIALNSQYFQMLGYSYIESVAVGTFFAGALVIFAHFVPRIVRMGKSPVQQRVIAGGIFLFITAVFTYLAGLRTEYANATGGTNYSPWFFVLLSMFLFATAVFTYVFLMPTKADRADIERYELLTAKERAADERKSSIDSQLNAARIAKSDFRLESGSIMLYGWMMEKRIISEAKKAFAVLKAEMLRFRTDHARPDCLDADFPFVLTRYFDQID